MKANLPKLNLSSKRYKIVSILFGSFQPIIWETNLTAEEATKAYRSYQGGDPYESFSIEEMEPDDYINEMEATEEYAIDGDPYDEANEYFDTIY